MGFAGGADGAYGLAVMDAGAVERSGLTCIDAFPYDPDWVFEGEYRAAEQGRRLTLDRLSSTPATDAHSAPVDLVVTVRGAELALPLIEDIPGQLLLIFTDPTNGAETPEIGRWLVLPPLAPGSRLTVDFNKATLPHHLLSPEVFTCPASPPGNHVPIPVEAGERKFTYRENHSAPTHFEGNSAMSHPDLADKVTAYLRHLEKRDWAAARTLCADNATVWHSDGKGDSGIDENINGMTEGMDGIKSIKYTIARQLSQGDDVLQQHVLDVVTTDGADVRMSVAAYFGFTDGLISRIEEYGSPPAGWEES